MRAYHLAWIWLLSKIVMFAGVVLQVGPQVPCPLSPDGFPTTPSGVWVEADTPLAIGAKVFALSQGHWYRGEVIGLKSRGRVVVRYLGWDPFWEEIHQGTKLQLDVAEPADPDHHIQPAS